MVPPESVRKKLEPVAAATGESVEELWDRQSQATKIAAYPSKWRRFWDGLTKAKRAALRNNWKFWGRPAQQIPVVAFFIWLILAGRGWGKSRTGAQFVIDCAKKRPGSRGALVGATAADVRDVMINGDSGIIASSPPDFIPLYEPSKRLLTWPNGSQAICYTADQPNRMRGPNLGWAWLDELAAWRYPQHAWDMLMYCLRKGKNPQVCVTTTPRPIPLIKELVKDAEDPKKETLITKGTTWDNFWTLSKRWFLQVVARNKGKLSRQEIYAEILDKVEGALWSYDIIEDHRIKDPSVQPVMERVVVGVDPSGGEGEDNDECGIVACGRDSNGHGYTLADESCNAQPHVWARKAYELWLSLDADAIVVETNAGGEMAIHSIRSVIREDEPRPRIIKVRGRKGKLTRAEPISVIYFERRWHHIGYFAKLEDELCTYVPFESKFSPNRMDALVWAALELFPIRFVNN